MTSPDDEYVYAMVRQAISHDENIDDESKPGLDEVKDWLQAAGLAGNENENTMNLDEYTESGPLAEKVAEIFKEKWQRHLDYEILLKEHAITSYNDVINAFDDYPTPSAEKIIASVCNAELQIQRKEEELNIPIDPDANRKSNAKRLDVPFSNELISYYTASLLENFRDEIGKTIDPDEDHIFNEVATPAELPADKRSMPTWAEILLWAQQCQLIDNSLKAEGIALYNRGIENKTIERFIKKIEGSFASKIHECVLKINRLKVPEYTAEIKSIMAAQQSIIETAKNQTTVEYLVKIMEAQLRVQETYHSIIAKKTGRSFKLDENMLPGQRQEQRKRGKTVFEKNHYLKNNSDIESENIRNIPNNLPPKNPH